MISAKAALALVSGVSSLAIACCSGQSPKPGPPIGSIESIITSTAWVAGEKAGKGTDLYRGQRVVTDNHGNVTFKTQDLALCNLRQNSDVTIQPSDDVLMSHNSGAGSATCRKENKPKQIGVHVGGWTRIMMTDPVWTVQLSPGVVVVRVLDGSVTVGVTDTSGASVTLKPGWETEVRDGHPPGKPRPFVLSELPADELASYKMFGLDIGPPDRIEITSPTAEQRATGLPVNAVCGNVSCRRLVLSAQAVYDDGKPVPPDQMRWSIQSGRKVEQLGPGSMVTATLTYYNASADCGSKPYEIKLTIFDKIGAIMIAAETVKLMLKGQCVE